MYDRERREPGQNENRHTLAGGRKRRLFDSVFSKYMTAFVLIMFASFFMIATILTGVLRNYVKTSRIAIASSTASELEQYAETLLRQNDGNDMGQFVRTYRDELSCMLSAICHSAENDLRIFLTDVDGQILIFADGEKVLVGEDYTISRDLVDAAIRGAEIVRVGRIGGLMAEQRLVRTATVEGDNGAVVGTIFACAESDSSTRLLGQMMKTLMLAGIWVVLIALVAVYILTERITSPLRRMSEAAKAFSAGDFEVKVPVRGNDEVAELADAFNQMAESLRNLETMRSSFMANVSHDLRTPMTTIAGFIDSILAGAISVEDQPRYLGIISEEVKRLSRLVSLTLDISRIQAGDRKFVMAPFDICETARLILISFEQKIDAKRLEVVFDADEDNMTVYADRDAIYQILYNICDNAVKFSREGGRLEIAVRNRRDLKKVQVTVLNEGQGIPTEDIPYIFDQFYKGDKSRGLDKSGVGLGMFISKAIIDAHKEEIWVHSEYGKNCEFGFTISAKPVHPKGNEREWLS